MSERSTRHWDANWPAAAAFLAPNFIGFLCFTLFPVLLSFAMAFHYWTLRPHEKTSFVGLRNFADVLGVRALEEPHFDVLALYMLCVAALIAGLIGALLSNIHQWQGTRTGGALICVTGAAMVLGALGGSAEGHTGVFAFWFNQGTQGTFFGGILALICGVAIVGRENAEWDFGVGLGPGLLIALAVFGFWILGGPMWAAYEPRDARFWYYFYNTLFLMMGLPLAVTGALGLALLLNRDLPLGPAVPELRVRRNDVGIVIRGGEDLLCACLERADGEELAHVGPVGRIREQADQAGAVGDQLGRGDLGVPSPPVDDICNRCVDVQEAVVVEPHKDACYDHLRRRGDQGDPIWTEVAPVVVVDDAVVGLDHDQAGAVQPPLVDEVLDYRRNGGEVVPGGIRYGFDGDRRSHRYLSRLLRNGRGGGRLRCGLEGDSRLGRLFGGFFDNRRGGGLRLGLDRITERSHPLHRRLDDRRLALARR